jgi:hypothetical protein
MPGDEEDAMRQSARFLAWSVSLVLLAACGTAPGPIELQPLKTLEQTNQALSQHDQGAQGQKQVMGQQDISGILNRAHEAANHGDKAKVLSLLHEAKSSLGTSVMGEGSNNQRIAKHIDQAIGQIQDTNVNVREVANILVSQIQESLKASSGK